MIPLRVKIKGFLCYQQEQEVSFDGASLWMLCGLNGSGKSAVFDAVTFALFGSHRGGSSKAEELVNKNSDGFEVEFEFLQDHRTYRIRRTLKRRVRGGGSATQQILKRISTNGTSQGKWEVIPDTTKKGGFDAWIRDNIGLSYETFTSSVLLLQGKAEKLLDSTAKGRFEVLAGIVDLERYRRLHEKADLLRKTQEATVKSLRDRLAALPEVSAAELKEAQAKVQTAESARQQAWKEVERWQQVEFDARQCREVQQRLQQTQQKLQQTQTLMADADEIERDAERLRELQSVLASVKNAMEQQHGMEEAVRKMTALSEQQQQIERNLTQQKEELALARQKRSNLDATLQEEEHRLRDVSSQFREAALKVEKLKEYERQQQDWRQLQKNLQELGDDPSQEVEQLRRRCEELSELAQAAPTLARFGDRRLQLRKLLEQEKTATEAKQRTEAQGKKLKTQTEEMKSQLERQKQARQQADEKVTQTRTLLGEAQKHLDDLVQMHGAKVCRQCGQELTPAHMDEEKVRRETAVAEAKQQHQLAVRQQQEARQQEQRTQQDYEKMQQQTQTARDEYLSLRASADQAKKDVDRLRAECQASFAELSSEFQRQISSEAVPDWIQTTYPTADDLQALQHRAQGLAQIQKQLKEGETRMQKWSLLQARQIDLQQTLQRLSAELPEDHHQLRQRHLALHAEEDSLQKSLTACRSSLLQCQKDIDELSRKREHIQQELTKCRAEIQTQMAVRQNCENARSRFVKDLPEEWQQAVKTAGLTNLNNWVHERDQLLEKRTDERYRELQQARLAVEELKQTCNTLQDQYARYPEQVRQGPEAVGRFLNEAKLNHKKCDEELNQARLHLSRLQQQHHERQELQDEYVKADGKLAHAKLLAELLGRDRLQMHLVRQAERHVVDHANAMLDKLSGGELYLRLCGEAGGEGNAAKALELEAHNRVTGEKPINVAFLSGSQKFRVAVSLALGIGQYASRQHRPIESVIIDEGFGCLDRNARQVMIQELQNLRSQMRCILLVSHQEEFADAFSDGYHFELQNGTTIATRFQR